MATNAKVINNAENHLIVGSLEVIGDVTGSGMKTIRQSIKTVTEGLQNVVQEQDDYWSDISDDGIITPLEKTILKKEWNSIQQTYTAIMNQAIEQSLQNKTEIINYKAAYDALYTYLYSTIKVFDVMDQNTEINSRDVFNGMYSNYYAKENYTQLALAVGTIGANGYRVLKSLDEVGTDNEVAIYAAEIYQWFNNKWNKVGTNGYVGTQTQLPTELTGNYFMAASNFTVQLPLLIHEGTLADYKGDVYLFCYRFVQGHIYEYTGEAWRYVEGSDYRYLVTMTDYYKIMGEFPPMWKSFLATQMESAFEDYDETVQAALKKLREDYAADIEQAKKDLEAELEEGLSEKIDHVPVYLGAFSTDPSAEEGDWYCYNGTETTARTPGYVYRYSEGSWSRIEPTDINSGNFYMDALNDVLATQKGSLNPGYFSVIFCQAIFAHKATLESLEVQQIELKSPASISANYVVDKSGFFLDGETGEVIAMSGIFKGQIITGDGSTINGTCNVKKLHFSQSTWSEAEIATFDNGDIWMME